VKWTEYPTRIAYREGKDGTEIEGAALATAPGGGKWAVASGLYYRVRTRYGTSYCIAEECPQPPEPRPGERTCAVCGCTDSRACAGGCTWTPTGMDADICSRCQPALVEVPVSP